MSKPRQQSHKTRQYLAKSKYGLSTDAYKALLSLEPLGCMICGRVPDTTARRLSIDHDHATGVVRGLLCQKCNTGLGFFRDDPNLLVAAADYLCKARAAESDGEPLADFLSRFLDSE